MRRHPRSWQEEDEAAAAQDRAARDAARYRAGLARFLGVPVTEVAGEPVRNYRCARVRSYARTSPQAQPFTSDRDAE